MSNNSSSTATIETATAKPVRKVAPKATKPKAIRKAKAARKEADTEKLDRLPTTLAELRETKGGFIATLFLKGRDRDGIAKEVKAAFRLTEARAMKITRRIIGRIRLYQRIFELLHARQ